MKVLFEKLASVSSSAIDSSELSWRRKRTSPLTYGHHPRARLNGVARHSRQASFRVRYARWQSVEKRYRKAAQPLRMRVASRFVQDQSGQLQNSIDPVSGSELDGERTMGLSLNHSRKTLAKHASLRRKSVDVQSQVGFSSGCSVVAVLW